MKKPEALRLADELERAKRWGCTAVVIEASAAELRRLHAENASLTAALASSCDEQRHQLWESGGIAGCERARVAERQRIALLEALHDMLNAENDYPYGGMSESEISAIRKARAAIASVEETK